MTVYCMILFVWNFQKKKIIETDLWLAGAGSKDYKHTQENLGELTEMDCDDYCTTLDLLKISTLLTMGEFYGM